MMEPIIKSFDNGMVKLRHWSADKVKLTYRKANYFKPGRHSVRHDDDDVRLHFVLNGSYDFYHRQLRKNLPATGGYFNALYSEGFDIEIQNRSFEVETFSVQFPKETFINYLQDAGDPIKKFCEHINNGASELLSDQGRPLNASICCLIHEIIGNKYSNELKNLFLLSKSLELLALTADVFSWNKGQITPFLKNDRDREKIIAARDLINENLQSPPALMEIARMVGLNEYKLKRGFKELFKTTVFGHLADQRLSLARQYLRDTQMTAAEISFELGYASPQHFNNAFKKRFGITPNFIRKAP